MTRAPTVFLSYARDDGRELADTLRQELERSQAKILVWQDVIDLQGGDNWRRTIHEAIRTADFILLVATAAAGRSEYVWEECAAAREQGLPIIPVLFRPSGPADFRELPRWITKLHVYFLPDQLCQLVSHIQRPSIRVPVPFLAPHLPRPFVQRSDLFLRLRRHFTEPDAGDPKPGAAIISGPAGSGKTTLAAALAHDLRIRAAFDDGVLWISRNERGTVENAIRNVLDDVTCVETNLAPGGVRNLRSLLANKSYLIVLDDMVTSASPDALMRIGPACAFVLTTRNPPTPADALHIVAGRMTRDEAIQMLSPLIPAFTERDIGELLSWTSCWPSALRLAFDLLNRPVVRGGSTRQAVTLVKEAIAAAVRERSTGLTKECSAATPAAQFEAHLFSLTDANRERYSQLAVLPPNVKVPLTLLSPMWRLDSVEMAALLHELWELSLVDYDVPSKEFAMRPYLRTLAQAVGSDSSVIHNRIVELLGKSPEPEVVQYRLRWLPYHLSHAGRARDLTTLFSDVIWIQNVMASCGVNELVAQLAECELDSQIAALSQTLRLTADFLSLDSRQLPSQLWGRLEPAAGDFSKRLLDSCISRIQYHWLRPVTPSLTRAGGALLKLFYPARRMSCIQIRESKEIVCSGSDGVFSVYQMDREEPSESFGGGHFPCRTAISPKGSFAVAEDSRQSLTVWDIGNRRTVCQVRHTHTPWDRYAISDDRTLLVYADDAQELRHWDIATISCRSRTKVGSRVRQLAVSSDGGTAAMSFEEKGDVAIWDRRNCCLMAVYSGHRQPVYGITLSNDGCLVASFGAERQVRLWKTADCADLITVAASVDTVSSVAFSPDSRSLVVAYSSGSVKVLDHTGDAASITADLNTDRIEVLAVANSGNEIVTVGHGDTIHLWRINRPLRHGRRRNTGWIETVAVSMSGTVAISGSSEGILEIWDAATGRHRNVLGSHDCAISSVSLNTDATIALSWSFTDGSLKVWDIDNNVLLREVGLEKSRIRQVSVNPMFTVVGTLSYGERNSNSRVQRVECIDPVTGSVMAHIEDESGDLICICMSDEGDEVFGASHSALWRAKVGNTNTFVKFEEIDRGRTLRNASSDGHYIMSDPGEPANAVYRPSAGQPVGFVDFTATGATRFCLSEAAQRILVVQDCAASLFDLVDGKKIATLFVDEALGACSMALDGRVAAVGDAVGVLHFLTVEGSCAIEELQRPLVSADPVR